MNSLYSNAGKGRFLYGFVLGKKVQYCEGGEGSRRAVSSGSTSKMAAVRHVWLISCLLCLDEKAMTVRCVWFPADDRIPAEAYGNTHKHTLLVQSDPEHECAPDDSESVHAPEAFERFE